MISNQINTYRVLLTRARYETVIFVPGGSDDDPSRSPMAYDDVARFLLDCGIRQLDQVSDGGIHDVHAVPTPPPSLAGC